MTTSLEPPLTSATLSTFEGLGFLLAEPAAEAAQPMAHAARVAFRGPRAGRVELRVSDALLAAAAANMLGADAAPAPALCQDALGELANVIAGNLVPALDGPRAVYRLAAPAACALAPDIGAAARVVVACDEGVADVRVYLDGEDAA